MNSRSEDKKNISIHGIQLARKFTRAGVFSVVWIFSKKTVSRRTAATVSTRHRSMKWLRHRSMKTVSRRVVMLTESLIATESRNTVSSLILSRTAVRCSVVTI